MQPNVTVTTVPANGKNLKTLPNFTAGSTRAAFHVGSLSLSRTIIGSFEAQGKLVEYGRAKDCTLISIDAVTKCQHIAEFQTAACSGREARLSVAWQL